MVTGVLNIVAFAMLATVAVPLGAELMQSRANASTADAPALKTTARTAATTKRAPDIYYLVFDRYAGARTLHFAPGRRRGVPVATWFLQPVEFRHPRDAALKGEP